MSESKDVEMEDAEPATPKHKRPQTRRTWAGTQYYTVSKVKRELRPPEPWTLSSYIGPRPVAPLSRQNLKNLDANRSLTTSPDTDTAQEGSERRFRRRLTRNLNRPKSPPTGPPTISSAEVWDMRSSLTTYLNQLVGNPTSSLLDAPQSGVKHLQDTLPDLPETVQPTPRDPKRARWGELMSPKQPSPFEKRRYAETEMPEATPCHKRQRNQDSVPVPMADLHCDNGTWVRRLEEGDRLRRATEAMTEGVRGINIEDTRSAGKRIEENLEEEL